MYKVERLKQPSAVELQEILGVWEESVRATHDFLLESDIAVLRPAVREGVASVEYLYCVKGGKGIIAFLGVADSKIEMLFVTAVERGKGIGKALVRYAVDNLYVNTVDVNEQNPQAVGFYRCLGFRVVGRSEQDAQGRPFPLLHMTL